MAASTVEARISVPLAILAAFVLLFVSIGPASASGPDGRIQGFLTDSVSRTPITGAFVRLAASDLPWDFKATSDGSGYFQLAVPPHRYSLTASSPAHLQNTTVITVGSGQTVWTNMTLRPASSRTARLQGYVTDSVSAAPVTVGRIVARPWFGSTWNYENASAVNASGYFAIDLVPDSYDVATADVIGYTPYDYYPVYIGSGHVLWYNISLSPNPVNAWINGTIYDQITSAPIAGAQITARVDGLLSLPSVTSNGSGIYSMPAPSGTVEIAADALGHAPASTTVYVSSGGQYVQDLYLAPLSRTVRGYLKDGVTGAPMAGVSVTISPIFFSGYYDQTMTNASGHYQFAVPDDYYVVSARPTGYTSWSTWIIYFPGATAWANGTLWPIVSRISGYLTDATSGAPVAGLTVSTIDVRTSYQATTTADAFGFFTVAVPPSPAESVWVYGQPPYAGDVAYVATKPYTTTWVNFTLDRLSAQILANVTNALTGAPVAGASVIAAWFYSNDVQLTNASGAAALNAPVGISVYVTAIASGYQFWTGVLTPVVGANPLSIALWPVLPTDVHIRGWVRDASSGAGIWPASVEATGYDGVTSTAYTNISGYYDLSTVAAPQTVQARETGFAGSQASVNPASGATLWVNLTLAADSNPPQVRRFTATPSSGLDPTHPAALRADVNESRLDRADLSILMMYSSLAGVGTFLRLGYLDPAGVSIANPSNGSYTVSDSWDTRTQVGHLSDALTSVWWPVFTVGTPFLAIVSGYYNDATLAAPTIGNAVFDTREGRLLFVITASGFIGPQDNPTSTFAPYGSGIQIDLTTAAILGYSLVTGSALSLGTLHLVLATAVPSGTYAAFLELRDAAGGYTAAAVLMKTAADTVPPVANAGSDMTVNEDAVVTFDGLGSTDNLGVVNYTWTFVDGSPRSLWGAAPTYVFATPGTYIVTLTVRDANGNVATDTLIVTVRDVTNPTVSIASPSDGARVSGALTITSNATDNVGVVRVEMFVDGISRANDTASPFQFVIPSGSLALGNHTILVVAYDAAGNSASQTRHVTMVAGSGGAPLIPDVMIVGGLGLLLLGIIAGFALLLVRRRQPRPPPTAPATPPSSLAPIAAAPEQPVERPAPPETQPPEPDPDFEDLPVQ